MRSVSRIGWARVWPQIGLALLAIIAIAVAAFALSSHSRHVSEGQTRWPTVTAINADPSTAFIGGTTAAGVGASTPAESWPALLSASRGWKEVDLTHAGSGYVAAGSCASGPCPNFQQSVAQVVALKPSVVVVSGGESDNGNDLPTLDAAISAVYQGIRSRLPNATIIAVGPSSSDPVPSAVITNIDNTVRAAASSVNGTYVSLLNPSAIDSSMVADGGLNDAGQAAIAARVSSVLP